MIHLPSTPRTFSELLGLSIRNHFSVFKRTLWLIIFLVIVKDAYIYLGGFPANIYLYSLISIVMALLIIYLVCAMLYASHCVFNGENADWRSVLSDVLPRIPKAVLAIIIFIVVPLLLFMLGKWIGGLMMANDVRPDQYAGLTLVLSVGIPVMIAYLYYFYAVPNIIMENMPFWCAFSDAPMLVGKEWRDLVRVFGVYACGTAVWLLVSPDTLHGHLMAMYKVSAIYDFIVLSVTLPILMNLIVLTRNDLTLRREIRDAD